VGIMGFDWCDKTETMLYPPGWWRVVDFLQIPYEKKNIEVFNKLFSNHQLKTFNNQILKLQYYQYKYFKKSFRQIDILNHLRNHTCPKDIYNMIKEHKILVVHENFSEIFKTFESLDKINKYVNIYLN
jgi:hypothetical protein